MIETPAFSIPTAYGGATSVAFQNAFGLYLMCWFIFTVLMTICTTRSTVAFFTLFASLSLAFLFLGLARLILQNGAPHVGLNTAGGAFGLVSAIMAWWCALAGIATKENSFFTVPVGHFPWGETYKEKKAALAAKGNHHTA